MGFKKNKVKTRQRQARSRIFIVTSDLEQYFAGGKYPFELKLIVQYII
jgi:hypothetical protein